MHYLIITSPLIPARQVQPWYRRVWHWVRYLRPAPVIRPAHAMPGNTIYTAPDNLQLVTEALTAHGHTYAVGVPKLAVVSK